MTSWWQRLLGRAGPVPAAPAEERVRAAEIVEYAERQVWPGFRDRSEAVEAVTDHFADSAGVPDSAALAAMVGQVWHEREAVQASWSDAGDWGRLAAAFAELERSGWVARMDFTCCQTCGHAEIDDERSGAEHSYVFFHQQDTERLAGTGPHLYLSYSYFSTHPGVDTALLDAARSSADAVLQARAGSQHARIETAVGATLVECLRRHGLEVDWNGSHEARPLVLLRNWRKPLPVEP